MINSAPTRSARGGILSRDLFDERTGLLTQVGDMRVDGPVDDAMIQEDYRARLEPIPDQPQSVARGV